MKSKTNPELEKLFEIAKQLESIKEEIWIKFIRLVPGKTLNIVIDAPYSVKDRIKGAGFYWNPDLKIWHYEFTQNFQSGFDGLTDEQKLLFEEDKW